VAFIIIKALILGGVLVPIGGFFTMVVPAGAIFPESFATCLPGAAGQILSVMLMLNIALASST